MYIQTETDSWIENAANGLMGTQVCKYVGSVDLLCKVLDRFYAKLNLFDDLGFQIVKEKGQIKFVVDIFLGLKFSMTGTCV